MTKLTEFTETEKLILIKAIASGEVTHLTPESIFTFSSLEADGNPNLIKLGKAQTLDYETVIQDNNNRAKPLKSLKTGENYNFDDLELLQSKNNTQFICADIEALANRLSLIETTFNQFNI